MDVFSFSDICIKCETEFQIFCIFNMRWILRLNYELEVTLRKSLQRPDIKLLNIHDFPQSSGKVRDLLVKYKFLRLFIKINVLGAFLYFLNKAKEH